MGHRVVYRGAAVIAALKDVLKDNRKQFYRKTCRYFWREKKKSGGGTEPGNIRRVVWQDQEIEGRPAGRGQCCKGF